MTMVLFCATMMLINIKTSAWCKFASSKGLTHSSDVINVAAILCPTDASTFEKLSVSANDQLFDAILANPSKS